MKVVRVLNNWHSRFRGNMVISPKNGGQIHPCALGRSGLTYRKKEGDGATPIGSFRPLKVYYRADRTSRPETGLPVEKIDSDLGWCDASTDRNYNRSVKLPYSASHETMMRQDHLYNIVVVLDYNITVRKRACGSAIFFHLAHDDFRATEGCIAVTEAVMRAMLRTITKETRFVIGKELE